jgi:DNA-binding NarL/FixJ family response regulator
VIRVQLAGRTGARLDALRARLDSPSIDVVGHSHAASDALDADADVVLSVDGVVPRPRPGDGPGPALIVVGGEDVVGAVAAAGHAVWGVVSPNATGPEIRAAIAAVAEGLLVLPADAASLVRHRARDDEDDEIEVESLTAREREVLELASRGLSNRDAAAALGISEHTVKFHLASVYGKLGAGSRTEAVRRGLRRGLIAM